MPKLNSLMVEDRGFGTRRLADDDIDMQAVSHANCWGLEHRDLSGVQDIGIEEIARARGQIYLTVIDEIG